MILGLTGYPGVGKDTAADFLVRAYDYKKVSFASKLKELAYNTNPVILVDDTPYYLKGLVDEFGWEKAKRDNLNVRVYPQNLGQGARETFHEDFWINQALTPEVLKENTDIVISDVRYENEVKKIVDMDGFIIRIVREGYGPVNNHKSEKEMSSDYVVTNSEDTRSGLEYGFRELLRGLRTLRS